MVAKINYHVHFLLKIVFNQNIINILFLQSFHFIKLPVTSMCSFLGCLFFEVVGVRESGDSLVLSCQKLDSIVLLTAHTR